VLGNKIKELYSGKQESGAHEVSWDIKSHDGFELSSGSYILELKSQPIGSGKTFIARNLMIASK
jgi:hypothetical protein